MKCLACRSCLRVLVAFVAFLAAGCGGGAGTSDINFNFPPSPDLPAPTGVSLAYGPRRIDVQWPAVAGAASYIVVEDPDGPGPLPSSELGATTGTTFQVTLRVLLPDRVDATYGVLACRGSAGTACGALSAPVTADIDRTIGYFKATNADAGDAFGTSVALSGDGRTLAIGIPGDASASAGLNGNPADNTAPNAGAVQMWRRIGAFWSPFAYLKASNAGAGDRFGTSVALSGDGTVLAVGAPGEDSASRGINGVEADESAADAGAVYVSTLSASTGGAISQSAYIKAANAGPGAGFGTKVALASTGNVLAVGAPREASAATGVGGNAADVSAPGAGAAYLFSGGPNGWVQSAYVKASNTQAGDAFGTELALSGDGAILVVGAPGEASAATGVNGAQADNSAPSAGAVYVFSGSAATFAQEAYIKASNSGAGDAFGTALALSADASILAVGAPGEGSGGVRQGDDSAAGAGAGAVYVFRRGAGWSQEAYVKASNAAAGASFGSSVSLAAGPVLAVGAAGEASGATGVTGSGAAVASVAASAGAAYLFRAVGSSWLQKAYLKASNTGAGDAFGRVQLSSDGTVLAVGAPGEASASGNPSDNAAPGAGAVYLE